MHTTIAAALAEDAEIRTRTATLQEPEHGLTEAVLAETDVLSWWGHAAHGMVADEVADRVQKRMLEGMGLLVLHSGHYSKTSPGRPLCCQPGMAITRPDFRAASCFGML
jgi:trehalose utilization protein